MASMDELKEEILSIIEARKETYGRVLVQSGILKRAGKWVNVVTKIFPLHSKESPNSLKRMDYGNFAIVESLISLKELINLIRKLSAENSTSISLEGYQVEILSGTLSSGNEYESGDDYLNIEWFFKCFHFSSGGRGSRVDLLLSSKLPLFLDSNDAIRHSLGVDVARSSSYGLLICLPSYFAKIKEIRIGPKELSVSIETKEVNINDVIAKCYCRSGDKLKQGDISFSTAQGRFSVGFRPETAMVALISKSKTEMLDKREISSRWRIPKDVIIDIPEFEIKQLIEQGESNTVEFKRQIESRPGDVDEFVESVVAFANLNGGVILLGVDDDTQVYGLSEKDSEERINDIVRSHCVPEPKYECKRRSISEKQILAVRVEEGSDKPYTVWQKGVFIRAGGSDRIAERYELDEMYRSKSDTSLRPAY